MWSMCKAAMTQSSHSAEVGGWIASLSQFDLKFVYPSGYVLLSGIFRTITSKEWFSSELDFHAKLKKHSAPPLNVGPLRSERGSKQEVFRTKSKCLEMFLFLSFLKKIQIMWWPYTASTLIIAQKANTLNLLNNKTYKNKNIFGDIWLSYV